MAESAPQIALSIVAERGVILSAELRQEMNSRLPFLRKKGIASYYFMMAKLEDDGRVVKFIRDSIIDGVMVSQNCYRLGGNG